MKIPVLATLLALTSAGRYENEVTSLGYTKGNVQSMVDVSQGGSDYHFSWRHDGGRMYEWAFGNQYCASLGKEWHGVSIESLDEDRRISSIVAGDRMKYIWTGGVRQNYKWLWPSGAVFVGLNWSPTGGDGRPQPDNREGRELCLAILNNFYDDGIRWHDIACHHEKPIICERISFGNS
ncbi:uncharacterized protein [Penaeus vannamei]|uniref:uncharacterized protein n=1 Tax=Penaeus vannamei TaxID=6689 RepID=UPI00387FA59E